MPQQSAALQPPPSNTAELAATLKLAWSAIRVDCLSVLGSELHYQAMIYHCLRTAGQVPIDQIGMNVKMWIEDVVTDHFRVLDVRKHEGFRGGFEPIPDIVLFAPDVAGDWRRRNRERTLLSARVAIEVKASERAGGRLAPGEIERDIDKLCAHREEARHRGGDFLPVMLVVDSAPDPAQRMTDYGRGRSHAHARQAGCGFLYLSQTHDICDLPD